MPAILGLQGGISPGQTLLCLCQIIHNLAASACRENGIETTLSWCCPEEHANWQSNARKSLLCHDRKFHIYTKLCRPSKNGDVHFALAKSELRLALCAADATLSSHTSHSLKGFEGNKTRSPQE